MLFRSDDDAYPDMMDFVKSPDFFDSMDFIMPVWSEQCSPDHSVFSSPGQYPQLVNGVPQADDLEDMLLPASVFEIDSPNFVSNHPRY